jgi:hypothetical protein
LRQPTIPGSFDRLTGAASVRLTILYRNPKRPDEALYRNPKRPDEAGTTMIAGHAEAEAAIDRLETRGFVVDKITFSPIARDRGPNDESPPAGDRLRASRQLSE